MKKTFSALLLLSCLFAPLCAIDFGAGLPDDEKRLLENQDIVVRFIGNPKKICVEKGLSPQIDFVIDQMVDLKANYLAEVLWSVPVADYEHLLEDAEAMFRDMETFKEIPYYSEQNNTITPLFTIAELVESNTEANITNSLATFCMDPFDTYHAELYLEKTDDTFLFFHKSIDVLHFAGLRMIGKGKMRAAIAVVRDGDQWIVYAAGGVKALRPPFMRKRLDSAFNNRIKDFAVFYINKIKGNEIDAIPNELRMDDLTSDADDE